MGMMILFCRSSPSGTNSQLLPPQDMEYRFGSSLLALFSDVFWAAHEYRFPFCCYLGKFSTIEEQPPLAPRWSFRQCALCDPSILRLGSTSIHAYPSLKQNVVAAVVASR